MDEPQQNPAYEALAERLFEGGIQAPPVYADVARALRRHADLAFATRDLPVPLSQAGAYIEEFRRSRVAQDYTAIGIGGTRNRNAHFHYYMVRGTFGLFLQCPVQGAEGDDAPAIAAINKRLQAVEALLASPPAGPLALIDVIDNAAILSGPRLDALTATLSDDPLATFLNAREQQDSDAMIMAV
ncbi:MAG: hypothetical protein AAF318_01170 [Pseudomonadota bacterium]